MQVLKKGIPKDETAILFYDCEAVVVFIYFFNDKYLKQKKANDYNINNR